MTQRLCETLARIAFIAGKNDYYGGDGAKDISDFIEWAEEFHRTNDPKYNDNLGAYSMAVYEFTIDKIFFNISVFKDTIKQN